MFIHPPVFIPSPFATLFRMSVSGPSPQHPRESIRQILKALSASRRAVVVGPTHNHWIEPSNESLLVHVFVGANCFLVFLYVPLYGCLAWFDDAFETKWLSMSVCSRLSSTNGKLADMKP